MQSLVRTMSAPLGRWWFSSYFTLDPETLSAQNPYQGQNYVGGRWKHSKHNQTIPDPLNGENFLRIPDTQDPEELREFVHEMRQCPISGSEWGGIPCRSTQPPQAPRAVPAVRRRDAPHRD